MVFMYTTELLSALGLPAKTWVFLMPSNGKSCPQEAGVMVMSKAESVLVTLTSDTRIPFGLAAGRLFQAVKKTIQIKITIV